MPISHPFADARRRKCIHGCEGSCIEVIHHEKLGTVTNREEGWLAMTNEEPSLGGAAGRFLNWLAVGSRVSLSRSTVWRKIQEGSFPAPIRISKGRVGWLEADIERWINAQLQAANRRQNNDIPAEGIPPNG